MSVQQLFSYAPNKSIVGLYFSASYCNYCTIFTPMLQAVYPHLQSYDIEIVLVGSDKTDESYDEYSKHYDWPVINYYDPVRSQLRELYGIKTIPALVFLDQDGNVINADGRYVVDKAINDFDEDSDAAKAVVEKLGIQTFEYDSGNEDF